MKGFILDTIESIINRFRWCVGWEPIIIIEERNWRQSSIYSSKKLDELREEFMRASDEATKLYAVAQSRIAYLSGEIDRARKTVSTLSRKLDDIAAIISSDDDECK